LGLQGGSTGISQSTPRQMGGSIGTQCIKRRLGATETALGRPGCDVCDSAHIKRRGRLARRLRDIGQTEPIKTCERVETSEVPRPPPTCSKNGSLLSERAVPSCVASDADAAAHYARDVWTSAARCLRYRAKSRGDVLFPHNLRQGVNRRPAKRARTAQTRSLSVMSAVRSNWIDVFRSLMSKPWASRSLCVIVAVPVVWLVCAPIVMLAASI